MKNYVQVDEYENTNELELCAQNRGTRQLSSIECKQERTVHYTTPKTMNVGTYKRLSVTDVETCYAH
jgi:hypothetical protein